ncbi:DUF1878 family protein [Virgibacillus doumboii]|uniref:DUF1878 family protein n=1 Tax=Virgibacillus doumboii TaxID=2697503 RepID=UPI001FE37242|nr:DUF1878 family protein [Virgibacillus doumboii]
MKYIEQNETAAFHLRLLSKIIDFNQYPLIKLLIESNVTESEFEELMDLLAGLNNQYVAQKEEGFLDFTLLLIHFAGMLNEKLNPDITIYALKKEGYYPSLMDEFIKILSVNEKLNIKR